MPGVRVPGVSWGPALHIPTDESGLQGGYKGIKPQQETLRLDPAQNFLSVTPNNAVYFPEGSHRSPETEDCSCTLYRWPSWVEKPGAAVMGPGLDPIRWFWLNLPLPPDTPAVLAYATGLLSG